MPYSEPTSSQDRATLAPTPSVLTAGAESEFFSRQLLAAMVAFRDGDFAVRLPGDLTGLDGKIADAFNDIVDRQRAPRARRRRACRARSARKASSSSA